MVPPHSFMLTGSYILYMCILYTSIATYTCIICVRMCRVTRSLFVPSFMTLIAIHTYTRVYLLYLSSGLHGSGYLPAMVTEEEERSAPQGWGEGGGDEGAELRERV